MRSSLPESDVIINRINRVEINPRVTSCLPECDVIRTARVLLHLTRPALVIRVVRDKVAAVKVSGEDERIIHNPLYYHLSLRGQL